MGKKKITMIAIIIAFCILLGMFLIIPLFGYFEYKNFLQEGVFMDGTTFKVSGIEIDASGMTAEKTYQAYFENAKSKDQVNIKINGEDFKFALDEYLSHSITEEDFEKYIGDISFKDYFMKSKINYSLKDTCKYSGGIGNIVQQIIETGSYPYEEEKDAYFDTENMEVIPEVYGTRIVPDGVQQAVDESIKNGIYNLSTGDEEHYIKPSVTEDDIKEKYADLIAILDWSVSYKDSDVVIKLSDYKDSISVHDDGTYEINDSFLTNAVFKVSETIDRTYESIKFKSEKDGEITVKGGTYGPIMHNKKEIEFLKKKLKERESITDRVPIWKCVPLEDGKNPDDYIEVDLSEQHVWHYSGGKLCCDSKCVTGDSGKKRDTPKGAYYITEKIPGKYLTGEGYKTWVNRWMRLTNRGVGLHDAGWRRGFGGNIYKTNGSHGCVNLPKKYAYNLYDEVDVGILVVVHK